ncbi:HEPN/Toprim-associated domain-containing protein [Nocardioides sp.]|uniref:HEPN/Toprim-associated domain-containing protein n=1 Tax=Nocardioides sp. TaxID=35761 RepID=UPI00321C0817
MGTEIRLTLNGIDIDYGKNRYWNNHHWLFPPGSLKDIEYSYADNMSEMKPGFEASLEQVRFRMCHLGYSLQETKTKFDTAVVRWNRTANLGITFADFYGALASLDFVALTSKDLEPFAWDFRDFIVHLLTTWDTDEAFLEDFIRGLDVALTLRVLADRRESRSLKLSWQCQDLIDSGWVAFEDLTDIDRQTSIINHTVLIGRIQDYAGATTVTAFDRWLVRRGLPATQAYTRLRQDGSVSAERTTMPTAVRNMIHHPENPHNVLTDEQLRESIELLLTTASQLPTPLPGLS